MSLLEKLYKSRNIIIEMMEERGYNMNDFKNYSINEIELMYSNHSKSNKDISPLDIKVNNVYIKYILTPKIRISNIINLLNSIKDSFDEGDTIILILNDKISSENSIEEYFSTLYKNDKLFVQYFDIDSITFNVSKHELVPKHTILSEDEQESLIKSLYIKDIKKLPKIKKTDPISKYHGIKKGQVFKIERPSETSGLYNYYRLCE